MTTLTPLSHFLGVWAKRGVTYGAAVLAVLTAATFFALYRANSVELSYYGLDPAPFSPPLPELIAGGVTSLTVFGILIALLWLPIGRPISTHSSHIPTPPFVDRLNRWVTADPAMQREKALAVGIGFIAPCVAVLLFLTGTIIGQWRASSTEWIVQANRCRTRCYIYNLEGPRNPVVGKPIAANGSRIAVVTGKAKAEIIAMDKLISVERYVGSGPGDLGIAPWYIRWTWRVFDLVNGNW